LEPREFLFHALESLFRRPVGAPEAVGRDLVVQVEAVGLVHLLPDSGRLGFQGRESPLLGLDLVIRLAEMLGHIFRGEEEALELLVEDRFQIAEGNLVTAAVASVLGGVRGDVHPLATVAEDHPGEEMRWRSTLAVRLMTAVFEQRVAPLPEFTRNDRLDGDKHPVLLGLEFPVPTLSSRAGVVRAANPLRRWIG
jgi:hypothetical protein